MDNVEKRRKYYSDFCIEMMRNGNAKCHHLSDIFDPVWNPPASEHLIYKLIVFYITERIECSRHRKNMRVYINAYFVLVILRACT